MSSDQNTLALDQYALGWNKGDPLQILPVLDKAYTLTMSGMDDPIKLDNFVQFFIEFRKDAEAAGGPEAGSDAFMKFKNIIRRQALDICYNLVSLNHNITGWRHSRGSCSV